MRIDSALWTGRKVFWKWAVYPFMVMAVQFHRDQQEGTKGRCFGLATGRDLSSDVLDDWARVYWEHQTFRLTKSINH